MANDPSFFDVDTWVLDRDEERLAKLDGDPEWQDHLREVQRELPPPAWVHALADDAPRRRRPWWWAVGLVAATLVALFLVWPRPSYVGVKGDLDVTIYLEEGKWDGAPIPVGVPLRLELTGPPAAFYAVLLDEGDETTVVSAGSWPDDGVVPGAWAFDTAPGPSTALVVLALSTDPAGQPVEVLNARAEDRVRRTLVAPPPK